MWNSFNTSDYEGMIAETTVITGYNGDDVKGYLARPLGAGPFPGIVFIPHMPGWDEITREFARRFAHHGFIALSPNIFERYGQGAPDDVAAAARGAGGLEDASVIADSEAAMQAIKRLPNSNGKVGIAGPCSGGRHAFLVSCSVSGFDATVDLWGGRVVMAPDALNERTPVSPIDLTKDLNSPLLGIFGNEDQNPSPEQVDQHEEELKKHGKDYEFHRYDGAGHGFWYHDRPAYRPEAAMDSWNKTLEFFQKHLSN